MASKTFMEEDCTKETRGNGDDEGVKASAIVEKVILKIPEITIIYWCEKMTATTFGGKELVGALFVSIDDHDMCRCSTCCHYSSSACF